MYEAANIVYESDTLNPAKKRGTDMYDAANIVYVSDELNPAK